MTLAGFAVCGWVGAVDEAIRALEEAASHGWRAVDQERLGGWLLRAAEGFTGRANSALPLGAPDRPLPDAVEAVRRWYRKRGLPATIAVPFPLAGPAGDPLDELLARQGWTIRPNAGVVMTAATQQVARFAAAATPAPTTAPVACADPPAADPTVESAAGSVFPLAVGLDGGLDGEVVVRVSDRFDDDWLGLYHYQGRAAPAVATRLLLSAPWQAFASARIGGTTVGIGRVAVAAGWAGLTAVETAPGHRRRGLATVLVGALARAAAGQQATRMYLQVEPANQAARALYTRCGFVDSHRYHYRVCPSTMDDSPRG